MNADPLTPESAALPAAPALPGQNIRVAQADAILDFASRLAPLAPQAVGLARAATKQSGGKPGWKTTEFWLCALVVAGNIWAACSSLVKPDTAALVSGVLAVVYTFARSRVKSSAAPLPQGPLAVGLTPAAPLSQPATEVQP